jgi:heme-degrading monooxygenase HmoA
MTFLSENTSGKYAVIFTARLTKQLGGYEDAVSMLRARLKEHEGFLGLESVSDEQGEEITISYWDNERSIRQWRDDPEHQEIRNKYRTKWYAHFKVRVVRIEREYEMSSNG